MSKLHLAWVGLCLAAWAAGIMLITPHAARTQVPDDFTGFRLEGRHLYDALGSKVILVGVNKMVIWTDRDGLPSFAEIAKTGANAVRIVWLTEGSAEELDTAITNAINHKLIPIVDCHDSTGKWDVMPACVDYWVRPDVLAVLRRHEQYLLVNIANEAGSGVVPSLEFRTAYELAIRRIRAAGLHVPLIIDAQGWGQQINDLQANGPYLVRADPDHNLMFSIHMWWPSSRAAATKRVIDEIAESVAMDLPLIIGEFANKGPGCTCCIPYDTIIEQAHLNEIGYLPWSWGPGNQDCDEMDMTEDGTFDTLHGWGLEVAITSAHSIQAIAVRPDWIVAMAPLPTPTPVQIAASLPHTDRVLSLGRPIEASSVEGDGLEGPNAVDGNMSTRWSSAYADPQSLTVDLGTSQTVARIVLQWETAYGREYRLQTSEDGESWIDVVHVTDGDGDQDDHRVAATGRYVRLLGLKRGTQWGYSLYEIWVLDSDDAPLPQTTSDESQVVRRPDLVISEVSWTPDPIRPGDRVTFSAVVENHGEAATSLGANGCAFQIGNETVARGEFDLVLAPADIAVCTADDTWGPVNAGEFIVLAWVDDEGPQPYGQVEESDETNNVSAAAGVIREATPTPTARPTILPSGTPTPAPDVVETVGATAKKASAPTTLSWVFVPVAVVVLMVAAVLVRSSRRR